MLRSLYDRFFLTLYLLMLKTPSRRTADDSAAKLVVIALFFYTVPLVIYALDAIAGSHIPYAVFFTIIFGYGVLIYWLNMRYFLGRGRLKYIISNYKIASPKKWSECLSYVLVVLIVALSPFLFLVILQRIL